MLRVFYTLLQFLRYRKTLSQLLGSPKHKFTAVTAIDPEYFQRNAIKNLILDFDGVLACHGQSQPLPEVVAWLQTLSQVFAGQIYLLSNKPNLTRKAYFAAEFPAIKFISGVAKKPYPDGIMVCKATKGKTLIVDDRILTGVLAAVIADIEVIYITNPWVDRQKNRWVEGFFQLLRVLERKLVGI